VGFYYGSTHRFLSADEVAPAITPREYVDVLSDATLMVISSTPQDSDTCRSGAASSVAMSTLVMGLHRRLRDRPVDATTYRMLAIAELHAGNCKAAVRHLAIAVKILLAPPSHECLRRTMHARVELALLLPVLIPLCVRLSRRAMARRLVSALLSRVVGG
jgi:hypothetical protein